MTTKISLAEVKTIHAEVTAAIKQVLEKRGYKLGKDKCRYSDYEMKFAIEAVKNDPDAVVTLARQKFGFEFKEYGIDFGTVVTDRLGKRTFKVEGFTRTGKLEARDQRDGKIYTGKPEIFYLNGVKLQAQWEKDMAKRAETTPVIGAELLGKGAK